MKRHKTAVAAISIFLLSIFTLFLFPNTGLINIPKTGQITSYAAADDGALQKGTAFPNPRFSDNGNGTITDRLTGLMWEQSPSTTKYTWENAFTRVAEINGSGLGGYTDWRLPNILELESIVNAEQTSTCDWLITQGFSGIQNANYWTSSTCSTNTANAYYLNLQYGNFTYQSKTSLVNVIAVRAGD